MKKFLMLKLVFMFLVGTVGAQVDKVSTFARAIAKTEGFYSKGTIPNRFHNPGDLRARARHVYPGQVGLSSGGYVIFKTDRAGWTALQDQIRKVLAGESHFYTVDMTIRQLARRYATNYKLWAKNVAGILVVPPSMTLQEYFEIPPRVLFTENRCPLAYVLSTTP